MTAAEALIKAGAAVLPTDMSRIAAAHDIKIVSYEDCADCYTMDIGRMYREISTLGFSFRADGSFIAVINGNACGRLRRRWTTAHELAHILLGHVGEAAAPMDSECERAADSFAAELLAPLEVLHFCGVSSAEEIQRLCGLSKQAAEIRFRQLAQARRKSSALYRSTEPQTIFTRTEQQRALLAQFMPFISEYITRRSVHDGYGEYLRRLKGHGMEIE